MAKSRYFPTKTLFDAEREEPRHYATWDVPENRKGYSPTSIVAGLTCIEHVWQAGDRMDKLAAKYWEDDQYGWLLCFVNNIPYPFGIKEGTVIRVPTDFRTLLERLGVA